MQRSIVLVTVDCLRADHVGFMGYDRPTTPFLDSLAQESFVIPTAIAAGAPTYYSLPAILASRFPLALGRDILGVGPTEPTLASVLKNEGYSTAAFGAGNPYLSARFGYQQGFDTFRDFLASESVNAAESQSSPVRQAWSSRLNQLVQKARPSMGPLGPVYDELYFRYCQRVTPVPTSLDDLRSYPAADVIVDHACDWLLSMGTKPFFLWLHLMDPHSPYYPKEAALGMLSQGTFTPRRARYVNSFWNRSDLQSHGLRRHREEIVALYDAGIRWADEQVKRLVGFLQSSNRWDDCIFALTADHGEEFLEHSGRYHPPTHLFEELIHVPLIVRVPGMQSRQQQKSPFSLVHLSPTLLGAAQVQVPAEFQERNFVGEMQRGSSFEEVAISECVDDCTNPFHPEDRMGPRILAVRESRYKLVIHFRSGAEKLYDLEADPAEQSALPPQTEVPVRRRLLAVAREHLHRSIHKLDHKMRLHARLRSIQLDAMRGRE
jgi:arylsulfatase A-like enzyme